MSCLRSWSWCPCGQQTRRLMLMLMMMLILMLSLSCGHVRDVDAHTRCVVALRCVALLCYLCFFLFFSTRARKQVDTSDVIVTVMIYVFDLIFLNGEALLKHTLVSRMSTSIAIDNRAGLYWHHTSCVMCHVCHVSCVSV